MAVGLVGKAVGGWFVVGDDRWAWLLNAGIVAMGVGFAAMCFARALATRREYRELEAAGFRKCPTCLGEVSESADGTDTA
jgi:hypothetical protein